MTPPQIKYHRFYFVDIIRVVGTMGVVLIHSAAPLLGQFNSIPLFSWWVGNLFDSMARMCVPLFFMVSGYLLLRKSENLATFLWKRTVRVVIPLLVWSLFYIFFALALTEKISDPYIFIWEMVTNLPQYPAAYHLWFLYALIGLYLFIPILRVYVKMASLNLKVYYITLWLFSILVIPSINRAGYEFKITPEMVYGFSGYLILGHILGDMPVPRKMARLSGLVFVIGFVITALGTYYLTNRDGALNQYFYGYLSPNVILMACATFLGIKYLATQWPLLAGNNVRKIVQTISAPSLGIYLVHPVFLTVLSSRFIRLDLDVDPNGLIFIILLRWLLTFGLSTVAIYILWALPFGKKIVPS